MQYKDPELLDKIVLELAALEIYDLVKVDYVSEQMEQVKKDMSSKALELVQEKIKRHEFLLGTDFSNLKKSMVEGYRVIYPAESYDSYMAYSSSILSENTKQTVNQSRKSKPCFINL